LSVLPKVAFPVDHDQVALHAVVVAALHEFLQVSRVAGLVLEKLVDVLHHADAELLLGLHRKVEVGHLAGKQSLVQRPFGQGNFEEHLFARLRQGGGG
jgi:hypothetical protein